MIKLKNILIILISVLMISSCYSDLPYEKNSEGDYIIPYEIMDVHLYAGNVGVEEGYHIYTITNVEEIDSFISNEIVYSYDKRIDELFFEENDLLFVLIKGDLIYSTKLMGVFLSGDELVVSLEETEYLSGGKLYGMLIKIPNLDYSKYIPTVLFQEKE